MPREVIWADLINAAECLVPRRFIAAWKVKPSWYLVAKDDKMIPPPAQRQMASRAQATTVEVPGSHAVYVSDPKAVASLIEQAAAGKK